jgi:hypothetical protein
LFVLVSNFFAEILFDFKVEVGASSIPGAKLGAFLTFIGARRLSPQGLMKGKRVFKGRKLVVNDMKRQASTLVAKNQFGDLVGVQLNGEHLLGKDNSDYLFEDEIAFDPQHVRMPETNSVVKPGIGFAGVYVEADYFRDSSIDFDGMKNSISLGRYGTYSLI